MTAMCRDAWSFRVMLQGTAKAFGLARDFLRSAILDRRAASRLAATLTSIVGDLREMNRTTEEGFIRLLTNLRDHTTRAQAISGDYRALVEMLAGGEAAGAREKLAGMLEWAEEVRQEGHGTDQLANSENAMRRLEAGAGDLYRAARLFHVLAVCIRVEYERLGSAGADFEGLAAMVDKLAADLAAKSDSIAETCAGTRETVNHALATARQMRSRRAKDLPLILRGASESLRALDASQRQAADFSRGLAEDFAAIAQDISETINSAQYQDITRQRLEHVAEALEDGLTRLRTHQPCALRDAAAMARLESVQLRAAAADFGTAVARIEDALSRMAERIGTMARQAAQTLAGIGPEGHLYRNMEQGLNAVAAAIGDYANCARLLENAEKSVAPAIGPVAGFASHIREIGIRMQRISLNASVKAARLENAGAAMNAVAEAVQRAVADSDERTGKVLSAIAEISAWCGRAAPDTPTGDRGGDDLGALAGNLRTRGKGVSDRGLRLGGAAVALSDDVRGSVSFLADARRFSTVLAARADELEYQNAELGLDADSLDRLRSLERRYTMQTERALHSAVLDGVVEAASGDGDTGGNVEFF